ncbi:hypothetical protein Cgig2_019461 [Carnegiea gigantea]|uniref:K-box domain-containing protein n=1 Tax=Carnegiea gigantea TaxID=171969 RepID=A0A9Q1KRQ8_9CARY|nr:hypothetical protein Cgig2_019461 [Carnegiea gigantea]
MFLWNVVLLLALLELRMHALLDIYYKANEENQVLSPTSEAQLWKIEAENLRQQLQDLRKTHSQYLGEDLSELDLEHLEKMEYQIDIGSKAIRTRKEILMHKENMELHKKMNLMRQEMAELQKKVSAGGKGNDQETGNGTPSNSGSEPYDPIQLKLS